MDQPDTTASQQHSDEATETVVGRDAETGFATDGEWPINNRLRAEAMARAGVTTDPGGVVSDDLIADTKKRLAVEDAEAERNKPSMRWTVEQLRTRAEQDGLTVETDANKAAILSAIEAKEA